MRIPHLCPESFRTCITVDKKSQNFQFWEHAVDAAKVEYVANMQFWVCHGCCESEICMHCFFFIAFGQS